MGGEIRVGLAFVHKEYSDPVVYMFVLFFRRMMKNG